MQAMKKQIQFLNKALIMQSQAKQLPLSILCAMYPS